MNIFKTNKQNGDLIPKEKMVFISAYIFSMAELAKKHHIRVVLASVLPASSYSWSPSIEPADKIVQLYALLKEYANALK